ncbi:hypothetical protein IQ07DRAFT_341090 [Pyrenochaeta sp. DS3sAY3a]|nr:hypothetical protein IQ07DRAFT_341090 [Pyrenochaeta sp. DS3sAY3a]
MLKPRNCSSDTSAMTNRREDYRHVLDSLLAAGDAGEPLQAQHLPHLHNAKAQVALPAVLVPGCFHVAEISFNDRKIRYKEILGQEEAGSRNNLSLLPEANEYISTHWRSNLLRLEPSLVRQTRHPSGNCTWSVFEQEANMVMRTGHTSEFMELARQCVVIYDD